MHHPVENMPGKFYETKMDTDNAQMFDEFYEALVVVNKKMKAQGKTPNIERLEDSKVKVVKEIDAEEAFKIGIHLHDDEYQEHIESMKEEEKSIENQGKK